MHQLLFIHPDPKLVKIYERHLGAHFTFDSAHNGLSGLRKIRSSQPSVIVSDFHLPYLSGLSLLKFVRQHPSMGSTPFIFLAPKGDVGQALEFGASDWVHLADASPDLLLEKSFAHLKDNLRLLNLT
jgi:CheY-like chemotaxis protein